MNEKRLLKLATFLDALPPAKFDFTRIARETGKPMLEALKAGPTECGTVGCAIGWMPAVFPRLTEWVTNAYGLGVALKRDKTVLNFEAAEAVFGLDSYEAEYLFNPNTSPLQDWATPKQVGRHIRAFVKRGCLPTRGPYARRRWL